MFDPDPCVIVSPAEWPPTPFPSTSDPVRLFGSTLGRLSGNGSPRESLELHCELQQLPLPELLDEDDDELLLNELSLSLSTLPSSVFPPVTRINLACSSAIKGI